jgi:hypothetical protein
MRLKLELKNFGFRKKTWLHLDLTQVTESQVSHLVKSEVQNSTPQITSTMDIPKTGHVNVETSDIKTEILRKMDDQNGYPIVGWKV